MECILGCESIPTCNHFHGNYSGCFFFQEITEMKPVNQASVFIGMNQVDKKRKKYLNSFIVYYKIYKFLSVPSQPANSRMYLGNDLKYYALIQTPLNNWK